MRVSVVLPLLLLLILHFSCGGRVTKSGRGSSPPRRGASAPSSTRTASGTSHSASGTSRTATGPGRPSRRVLSPHSDPGVESNAPGNRRISRPLLRGRGRQRPSDQRSPEVINLDDTIELSSDESSPSRPRNRPLLRGRGRQRAPGERNPDIATSASSSRVTPSGSNRRPVRVYGYRKEKAPLNPRTRPADPGGFDDPL